MKSEHVETVFSFSVASYRSCKNLWKSCVEYHTFLCSRQCKQTTTSWMTDGQKQDVLDLRYRSVAVCTRMLNDLLCVKLDVIPHSVSVVQ